MSCETRNIERFDSLAPASLSLRPCRLCRGFPSRSILDFAEFTLSGVEGLEMTDLFVLLLVSIGAHSWLIISRGKGNRLA